MVINIFWTCAWYVQMVSLGRYKLTFSISIICFLCYDLRAVLRFRIRMDPHHFGKLDPDPHQSRKLDPDPHQSGKLDPDPHQSKKMKEGQFGALEARVRISKKVSGGIRIKWKGRIRIRFRIRLKCTGRIRNRIKVKSRIRIPSTSF
jgi:hypothetical protein